jgi:uncharacterized protein YceK
MKPVLLVVFALSLGGCATIIHGSKQEIGVSSTPSGATISLNGINAGMTPTVFKLDRKESQIVKVMLPGYAPYEMILTRKVDGWVFGNILFGGLIGLAIDAATGSMYKLSPEQMSEIMGNDASTAEFIKGDGSGLFISVTLTPDPNWEKVGSLEKNP